MMAVRLSKNGDQKCHVHPRDPMATSSCTLKIASRSPTILLKHLILNEYFRMDFMETW